MPKLYKYKGYMFLQLKLIKIPSKLEVAPPPKCGLDWVMDGWVMGDTP